MVKKNSIVFLSLLMACPYTLTNEKKDSDVRVQKQKSGIVKTLKDNPVLAAVTCAGLFLAMLYLAHILKHKLTPVPEGLIFDRKNIPTTRDREYGIWPVRTEGYWADSADPQKDTYHGQYPFPQANAKPWPGKEEFLRKLSAIEGKVREKSLRIVWEQNRGFSPSRLENDARDNPVPVGSGEFYDRLLGIVWPGGYREHYIDRHNVKPSQEFYQYVMSYPW